MNSKTYESHQLRDYQQRVVDRVHELVTSGTKRICVVLPTGGGKTVVGRAIIQRLGGHWLALAHRTNLISQLQERIPEAYACTTQLLGANGERPECDGILYDECHHSLASGNSDILGAYPNTPIVGLTATPERRDGKPLGDLFQELVVGAHYSELIEARHLVQCRIFAPTGKDDVQGLAANPVNAYKRYGDGQKTFAFFTGQKNAKRWAQEFTDADIPAAAIISSTPTREREDLIAQFRDGDLRVLTTHDVLTEGIDVTEASCAILGRKMGHVSTYLQAAGRVLRVHPGKQRATIIDLVGAYARKGYGPPTLDREYSLSGRPIRVGLEAPMKQCLECGAVIMAACPRCPECGHEFPRAKLNVKIWSRELAMVFDGEATPTPAKRDEWQRLHTLCNARGWGLSWGVKRYAELFGGPPSPAWFSMDDKRREHERLTVYAREKGYKPGYVAHKYRDTFGVWPRSMN